MALPFLSSQPKKKDQIIAFDLGARFTKAVWLQRKSDAYHLSGFTIQDVPVHDKSIPPEVLTEHFKAVASALGAKTKQVVLTAGDAGAAFVRQAELPLIPIPDMRMMLKFNAKNYLQQDYSGCLFDCHILPPRAGVVEGSKAAPRCRVLVGGAKQAYVEGLQAAAKAAGLVTDQVVPALIGPVNAFEVAHPQEFGSEVVALVDIGFKSTVICILLQGEMAMTRAVQIGGDKLTSGVSEALGVSYAEAEGIKIGLPEEVQSVMQALLMPLGRELRASIDFFEHQNDRQVSQVFLSGGASRSEFIVMNLQAELMVPCRCWNPVAAFQMSLSPQQMGEIDQVAPQLTVAVGAALGAL